MMRMYRLRCGATQNLLFVNTQWQEISRFQEPGSIKNSNQNWLRIVTRSRDPHIPW
ncbi:hypothetical protein SBA2_260112 [Acidobacteriia bacterium SbA2]|nr:hypothetical protein SBA2_260112 [Acidobacteriia bacterium SbA2]